MNTRFKEVRKSLNLTQKDVAEILNVSQTTYNRYESGLIEPDLDRLCKLADIFNVSVDYLLRHDMSGLVKQIHLDGIEEIIAKYPMLDQRGRLAVYKTVAREYEFSKPRGDV